MNEFNFDQPHPGIHDWFLTEQIAKSKWSEVFRAQPKTGDKSGRGDYVLKIAHKSDVNPIAGTMLKREAQIARAIKHSNLVSVLDAKFDMEPFFIVQPFLPGINLKTLGLCRVTLSVPFTLWTIRQVGEALQALHNESILHNDVAPQNVIVSDQGHVTLLDLGLAQVVDAQQPTQHLAGSLHYIAPEQLDQEPHLTTAVDVYALGVSAFELLTKQLPNRKSNRDEEREVLKARLSAADSKTISGQATTLLDLIMSMLEVEPGNRPSTNEVVSTLIRCEINQFAKRAA